MKAEFEPIQAISIREKKALNKKYSKLGHCPYFLWMVSKFTDNTIVHVVENGLCTGCGTCAGICPAKAISMNEYCGVYSPKISQKECKHCGICFRCCPGYKVNFKELNDKVFGTQPKNHLLGNYVQCYTGYSTDETVRFNSSSGGIVTQLLIYALENDIIDGALVVRMNKQKPLEPEVFIARTRGELLSSSKSKYCPVSMDAGLAEILKEEGRFAVVGLPCHIHGLRKAQLFNSVLAKNVVIVIGLFCVKTSNFEATKFFLKSIGVSEEMINGIDYRGNGWPGEMTITFKNGAKMFIPFAEYRSTVGSMLFTPQRCLLCSDALSELSDVSVGDAWLPKFNDDKEGTSIVITRSQKGQEILRRANRDNAIIITPVSAQEVIQSQKRPLSFKKRDLSIRLSTLSSLGHAVPQFVYASPPVQFHQKSIFQMTEAVLRCIIAHITARRGKLPSIFMFGFSGLERLVLKILR